MTKLVPIIFCLTLVACSDEVPVTPQGDIPAAFPDGNTPLPTDTSDTTTPGPSDVPVTAKELKLKFKLEVGDDDVSCTNTSSCSVFLSYNATRTLEVVLTGDGQPLGGQLVKFAIEKDEGGLGKLSSLSAYTNGSGIASVQAQPKESIPGSFVVKAWIDDDTVAPLYFDITITPKGVVPLTVMAKYAGERPLTTYHVRLYLQNEEGAPNCGNPDDLYNNQTANQQSPPTNLTQSVKFQNFAGIEEAPQKYSVLVYALNELGAVLAWGCNDADAEVKYGYSKTVIVDLADLPPRYKGTYEVTSFFDFISALPDEAQPYINILLEFFSSPTGTMLNLTCILGGDVLGEFCEFLFDEEGAPTFTGELVMDFLDTILVAFTKDTVWGDIMAGGSDIASMLKSFEMGALITFKEEPDEAGVWTAEFTHESWDKVVVKWSLDANCDPFLDEDCGKMQFSLGAIDQQDTVAGSFTASVANFWDLTIDEHSLNLKYGALINYVIEKQLLPLMTGWEPGMNYKIDSYEELFQYLLAGDECFAPGYPQTCCAKFAEEVAAQSGNLAEGLLESTCDLLSDLGAAYIRDALLNLDVDTGDGFMLGTGTPCQFYDADEDMTVDGFGTAEKMCEWKATIDFGFATTSLDGKFFAVRLE